MSNVVKFYFNQLIKSLIFYTVGVLLTLFTFMVMYPSFKDAADVFTSVLASVPQVLLDGIGLNVSSLSSILGYYAFTMSYVMLVYGVFSIFVGMYLNGYESSREIDEYLYVKPIGRYLLLFYKYMTGVMIGLISFVVFSIVSFFILLFYNDGIFDFEVYFMLLLNLFLFISVLYTFGFLCGIVFKRIRQIGAFATLMTVFLFFMNFVSTVVDHDYAKYFSPFGVFNAANVLNDQSLVSGLIYTFMIMFFMFVVGLIVYRRREL